MKQIFTLLLFGFFSLGLVGQITVTPSSLQSTFSEKEKVEISLTVNNTSTNTYEVFWKVIKSPDFPVEWETTMCDDNICYLPNIDACPTNKPNIFIGGTSSSAWSFKIDPKKVKGTGKIHIEFYSDSGYQNKIGGTEEQAIVIADSDLTTSTNQVYVDQNVALFPNPTPSYFSIKNDKNVHTVSVVNIIGKEIWTRKHTKGFQYDVSDLSKGVYIVRLIDGRNKLIKTLRLNKTVL